MWIRCRALHVGFRAMWRGGAACAFLVLASGALLGAVLGEPLGAGDSSPDCPPCPPPPVSCKFDTFIQNVCFYKVDNDKDLQINIEVKKKFTLTCPKDGITLNYSSLPRFLKPTNFLTANFEKCALPTEPYANLLERLNVSIQDSLYLNYVPRGELRADHFVKLETLSKLSVKARYAETLSVAAPNVTLFNPLTNLMELELENVHLPLGLIAIKSLKKLTLVDLFNCSLNEIQFNQLCDLPVLKTLRITDDTLWSRSSGVVCNFTSVILLSKKLRNAPSFPLAKTLYIQRPTSLQTIKNCSFLETLIVTNEKRSSTSLPDGWLAACTRLSQLTLRVPRLRGALSARALPAAHALTHLTITNTQLETLADDLFDKNTKLRVLTLSNNKLKCIDKGVFSLLSNTLVELDLSNNLLHSRAAVAPLGSLANLHKLELHNNPLGDLCDSGTEYIYHTVSEISSLKKLTYLSLSNTGATRLCSDWHTFARLETLYLNDNNITTLLWRDLTDWNPYIKVHLENNNLDFITMGLVINKTAKNIRKYAEVKVNFITGDTYLPCDCTTYWFAKALREGWFPVHFETLHCEGRANTLLQETTLDDMVCAEDKGCPTNCTCLWRPSNTSVEIDCSSRGLTTFPNLSAMNWTWMPAGATLELRARNNSIRELPELPARLEWLDMRDNALAAADERTVRALFAHDRRVLLAGNPLDCNCSQPMLLKLTAAALNHQILDPHCSDGRELLEAVNKGCAPRADVATVPVAAGGAAGGAAPWWAALAAALGALLLLGAMALALRRSSRLRLKAFLLARGYCLRWARPYDDDRCKYDAFLSYAHEDEAVALELLGALEGGVGGAGGAPLRLCVHHRDWQPGEWILGQIAKSVRESHRTIILLSENFAKSSWARAEFREAYAHALREDAARLIVVVLGDAPPADLDDDIRHYVRHNTYVRWGEPAFWEKLRVALPPGRLRSKRPRQRARPKKKPPGEPTAAQPQPAQPNPIHPKSTQPKPTKPKPAQRKPTQPKPTQRMPAQSASPGPQPAAPHRPPPLRTDPPVHPAPPRPPTPIVKFGQIDFSAPLKPADDAAPPCA